MLIGIVMQVMLKKQEAEARKFLEVIGDKKFTLPLYLDIEDPSIRGLGRNTLNDIIRAFGEVIKKMVDIIFFWCLY